MKSLLALFFLAVPLHAELFATFHTTRGNVVVALQYDKAPQTVANFITLAEGTRTRIDPLTGAVIHKPLYAGETFYRVVSNFFTIIAQTGSGTGTANGGPGYTIRDEFHPSLKHVPYVLSMANSGAPHTSGSQIFFTGNISVPEYDNSYTVFGLVTDPASRSVIDAIVAAGNDGTTINSISFNRTDAAARNFDELAWNLPVCSGVSGSLDVVPGSSVAYDLAAFQPAGSVFQVFRSLDLQSWLKRNKIYQGTGEPGTDRIILDSETFSKGFYNLSLVAYPDALAPAFDRLANRTLHLTLNGTETLTFQFDSEGLGGTLVYSEDPSPTTFMLESYVPEPHTAEWVMNTVYGYLGFVCPLDSETSTEILGGNTTYQYGVAGWVEYGSGALTLSK